MSRPTLIIVVILFLAILFLGVYLFITSQSIPANNKPSQKPAYGVSADSTIKYTGSSLTPPAQLPLYRVAINNNLTRQQAIDIAKRLSFSAEPTDSKNGQDNTLVDWQNAEYHLVIELETGQIRLSKLLNARPKTDRTLTQEQALKEISTIVSNIEGKPFSLDSTNSRIKDNPDNPNILSVEISDVANNLPVVKNSTQWLKVIHFNLDTGLVENSQYQVSPHFDIDKNISIINFDEVIKGSKLKSGVVWSLTQFNTEALDSKTGTYTIKDATFYTAHLAYFLNEEGGVNTKLVPVYVFEGQGEVVEIPGQKYDIRYLINAFD